MLFWLNSWGANPAEKNTRSGRHCHAPAHLDAQVELLKLNQAGGVWSGLRAFAWLAVLPTPRHVERLVQPLSKWASVHGYRAMSPGDPTRT